MMICVAYTLISIDGENNNNNNNYYILQNMNLYITYITMTDGDDNLPSFRYQPFNGFGKTSTRHCSVTWLSTGAPTN